LSVTANGFEPSAADVTFNGYADMALQRVVRVTAGGSPTPLQLAPNDVRYVVDGVTCEPCKMIRIMVPNGGGMEIRVRWSPSRPMTLFAGGQTFVGATSELSGVVAVSGPQELVVYFGATSGSGQYINFTLETTSP
jgi:hypothetical protein